MNLIDMTIDEVTGIYEAAKDQSGKVCVGGGLMAVGQSVFALDTTGVTTAIAAAGTDIDTVAVAIAKHHHHKPRRIGDCYVGDWKKGKSCCCINKSVLINRLHVEFSLLR